MQASRFLACWVLVAALAVAPVWAQPASGARIELSWGGGGVASGSDPVKVANSFEDSGTSGYGFHYSMSTSASADLSTGELKGASMASGWDHAVFKTTIFDRLVITGAPSSVAHIGIAFAVDGSGDLDDIGDANREFKFNARLTARSMGGPAAASSYTHRWGLYTFNVGGSEIFDSIPTGDVDIKKSEKSFFDVVLWNWLDIPIGPAGQSAPIDVQWWMDGDASGVLSLGAGFATLDVSHTGRAGLQLSAGFGYTSDSGVFLSAVPEPAVALLLPAGLLALLPIARRPPARAAVPWASRRG